MQQRWAALESTVAEAGRERDEAAAATARAEADLASLSAAYNGLEEHAARLEAQLEEARAKAASAAAAAAAVAAAPAVAVTANGSSEDHGGGGLSPQEVEERVAAAVAEALKQQQQQQAATRDKADGAETGEGLAAAIEAARVEAAAEAEDAMGDLLVCLGREEARVEVLSARLRELGEDVDALLEGVGDDGDEGASEEDEAARLDLGLA
jgi:DNA repair exonuclease SbcCD ATPase subunit